MLAFHFPEYLTTPELRRQYSVEFLRRAMFVALIVAGALFTALLAQISINVPGSPVPITGQTLAVGLVGASLGMLGEIPEDTPEPSRTDAATTERTFGGSE